MSNATRTRFRVASSDPSASCEILPLVYDELRRLAAQRLASERPDHTLQAMALIHDAYVRLVDGHFDGRWDSRGHFFAAAAEAMRRTLIDSARRKAAEVLGFRTQRPSGTGPMRGSGSIRSSNRPARHQRNRRKCGTMRGRRRFPRIADGRQAGRWSGQDRPNSTSYASQRRSAS